MSESDGDMKRAMRVIIENEPRSVSYTAPHRSETLGMARALVAQQARIETLKKAVAVCRDQFAFYTLQHRAKRTTDGNDKAATNEAYVDYCDAAIYGRELPNLPKR